MSEYTIYYEGEEYGNFDTKEEATKWLQDVRRERIEEDLEDVKNYPNCYAEGYNPEDSIDAWMQDVYELKQTVKWF